ncbi:MAG: acyltransferase [Bacteroidaceae bacterium]|nr:acyltransferase [Bacteroidaceae bacterium]
MAVSGKDRLNSLNILRVLAIITVVVFHCYGMMYADVHFPESKEMYKKLYWFPNQCVIINIAMPMLVFVSGYLFQYLLSIGKYATWTNMLLKKSKRLLIPYFVFGLLFMSVTGDWHPLSLFAGDYWHLWFLPMLFWLFVIGYFVNRYLFCFKYTVLLILVISFLSSFCVPFVTLFMGLQYTVFWFIFFFIGQLICVKKNLFDKIGSKYKLHYALIIIYLGITIIQPIEYGETHRTWYSVLSQICIIVALFYVVSNIFVSKTKFKTYRGKLIKNSYSFGIYIFHNWIAMSLISSTAKRLFNLHVYAADHPILFPLLFTIITIVLSVVLTKILYKLKVGKYLFG